MVNSIVILAADHNGVEQKQLIKELLNSSGYSCVDLGPFTDRNSVDYVDYAMQLGEIIKRGDAYKVVLICGTGVGMSIAANKVENISPTKKVKKAFVFEVKYRFFIGRILI